MEVLVGFVQLPARVGKGPPGRCAEPEGPHELKAWQVALLVIFLQSRVHIEFRICDDLVAEAINDQSDGVDAPETFVKSPLCHRYSSLSFLGRTNSAHGPILLIRAVRTTGSSARESLIYHATLRLRLHYCGAWPFPSSCPYSPKYLELARIGKQIFAHGISERDPTAFWLVLDTYATRLLAQALSLPPRATNPPQPLQVSRQRDWQHIPHMAIYFDSGVRA